MPINSKLLSQKIALESEWNSIYADKGYCLDLIPIEKEIKEIRKKMVFADHDTAKREIKGVVLEENLAASLAS